MTDERILNAWFGGNHDAYLMYQMLVELAHTWDDLVDQDKPVTPEAINRAFMMPLFYLPANAFYRSIQDQVLPMWLKVCAGYVVANHFEKVGHEHGLEIGHALRYAAGNIVAYAIIACIGYKAAIEILPEAWLDFVPERFDDYRLEHCHD